MSEAAHSPHTQVESLRAALALPEQQDNAALWADLARALAARGHFDEALAAFDRARELTPEDDVSARLALLRERRLPFARRRALGMLADYDAERAAADAEPETEDRLTARLAVLWELERFTEVLDTTRQLTALPDATAGQWLARANLARIALRGAAQRDEIHLATEQAVKLAPSNLSVRLAAQALRREPPPPDELSLWLRERGFRLAAPHGVDVVLPPVCTVPAGPFLMGSDPTFDPLTFDDEQPQHFVDLPDYAIGRYPVTVAEYARFVQAGQRAPLRWTVQLTRLDYPVVNVIYADAEAYAAWLSEQTGEVWRLPTEAEWEKAARWDAAARHSRIFPWGDTFSVARANTATTLITMPLPIGSFSGSASPYGVDDLAGGVWEWTSSLYQTYPYDARDGREAASVTADHVVRGGAWTYADSVARAACRGHRGPLDYGEAFGFRLVREGPEVAPA